jgi:hypothetical protein
MVVRNEQLGQSVQSDARLRDLAGDPVWTINKVDGIFDHDCHTGWRSNRRRRGATRGAEHYHSGRGPRGARLSADGERGHECRPKERSARKAQKKFLRSIIHAVLHPLPSKANSCLLWRGRDRDDVAGLAGGNHAHQIFTSKYSTVRRVHPQVWV